MTVAIQRQTRKPKDMSDRRRAAFERAQSARTQGAKPRSRYREKIGSGPKPLGFYMIAAITFILVAFGLVMVLSASSIYSFKSITCNYSSYSFLFLFFKIDFIGYFYYVDYF